MPAGKTPVAKAAPAFEVNNAGSAAPEIDESAVEKPVSAGANVLPVAAGT